MILSRLLVAAGLLVSAIAVAENLTLSDIPSCPLSCVIESVEASTCSVFDTHCQCTSDQIYYATAACVRHNCSVVDSLKLAKYQAKVCDRPIESQQGRVRGWLITQLSAVFLTTALRLYSCWKVKGGLYIEDYLIVVACCICGFMSSLLFLMVDNGFAQHIYQINSDSAIANIYLYFWINELSYTIIINLIKISLLCLFLRIFPNRKFRIVCGVMIGFLICVALMWAMLLTFQCQPISTNWNINIPHSKCHNVQIYAYVGAGSSMCEDIIIMVLPIPFLIQLQVSMRKKIGVLLIFSLGIFVVIISAIRMRSIYLFGTSGDPTWDNVDLTIWTAFEIAMAVVCCNLPSIAGLITHYRRIYFPGRINNPTDSARHLKWTGTTSTSGPVSPRSPPSPRFTSEKYSDYEDLMSIDEVTLTTRDDPWMRTRTTPHSSQSTFERNISLELGRGSPSRSLPWSKERDSSPLRDKRMGMIRSGFRVSGTSAGWPLSEPTTEHTFISTNNLTSASNPYQTSNIHTYPTSRTSFHPATQTPTVLPAPQQLMQISPDGSPNLSPPSPPPIEEDQAWPLPLRPPPFHIRRHNRDYANTNANTKSNKRLTHLSSAVITPRSQVGLGLVDFELASINKNESLRRNMI